MTETIECDVNDCEKPALTKVLPTHGETAHSAYRCRSCLLYDIHREWFDEWGEKIENRNND